MKVTPRELGLGSSTTSKTALGFGIAGTVLGAGAALASGGGLMSNLFGAPRQTGFAYPAGGNIITVDASGTPVVCGGCNCYVTEKELNLTQKNNELATENAKLKSEKYTVEYVAASLAPVYSELSKQKDEICDLKAALGMETERRACGDERLLEYVKGNYIRAEKSLNSKRINYHGVKPTLVLDDCCCDDENGAA